MAKRPIRLLMLSVWALFAVGLTMACSPAEQGSSQADLTPDEARAIAKRTYVFTYPLVLYYRTMYYQAIDESSDSYSGGFGEWLHLGMSSPEDTDIVTPNNDTPYSYAWVDLRAQPWVLTMPQIEGDRFYTSQWDDLWGFVLGNAGSVDDGNAGLNVLLVPPGWSGERPEGIDRVIQGETQFLGTLTRTQVFDQDDFVNAQSIQREYELQPLSAFLGADAPPPAAEIEWMEWSDGDETTEKYWEYVAFLLPFVEPHPDDQDFYEGMAKLGLERGKPWDPSALHADTREALAAGMKDALGELKEAANNITDPSKFFRMRRTSENDGFFSRALGVMAGIFGNVEEISVYFSVSDDADGELIDGSKGNYEMAFTEEQLPPVAYFWSVTMYRLPERWLAENELNRYSIGNSTPGVRYAEDGSLTLYLGPDSPGADKESNWLPAPRGPFWIVMRTYGPGEAIVNGEWQVPPVRRIE
ncbi:MAG: DUF1254 domain-containing protein [Gemmatimonadetes bacterium]|nr:DUF1254 domain-containing protein [Gemmatimonadota bacterium]